MHSGESSLAAFLRARRQRLDPSDLGFTANARRRTPGLRREEVATLAGVSVEYLTRLEQGRSSRPSSDVVDALARALRLDRNAHRYLRLLAGIAPPPQPATGVRQSLIDSIDALAPNAAYLLSPRLDVVTVTPAARAIFAPLFAQPNPHPNVLRWIFLDEATSRPFYPKWSEDATRAVAYLRSAARPDQDDPLLDELVAELLAGSAEFARRWKGHEVQPCTAGLKVVDHPAVGRITMAYESFPSPDQSATIILLRAAGDERSRTAFEILTTVELTDLRN